MAAEQRTDAEIRGEIAERQELACDLGDRVKRRLATATVTLAAAGFATVASIKLVRRSAGNAVRTLVSSTSPASRRASSRTFERDAELHRVELDEGEPLPDWREFDAIVAMGGPMSVNDDATLPWLSEEKRAIGDAVRAGMPFWGVCLGVQLLAASLARACTRALRPRSASSRSS